MIREIRSKTTSLHKLHTLRAWRYRELKQAITLLLRIILIVLPASFFLVSCSIGRPNPDPIVPIKLYSVRPDGLFRKGVTTPFDLNKPYIALSPEDFGELLNRCPTQ